MFENVSEPYRSEKTYRCPCCKFKTLHERAGYEICPVCWWEDDGQDDQDADQVRGGPNGTLSLTQARSNYLSCGAYDPTFASRTRKPQDDEKTVSG